MSKQIKWHVFFLAHSVHLFEIQLQADKIDTLDLIKSVYGVVSCAIK